MMNDIILGPKRHLEDENRICEMCAGVHDFTRCSDRATYKEVITGIGLA